MTLPKKAKFFYVLNFVLVTASISVLLDFHSSPPYPFDALVASLVVAVPIIVLQYPVLKLRKNWYYKVLVFYASMVLFLFLFGMVWGWKSSLGQTIDVWLLNGTVTAIFGAVFGQAFGGLVFFLPIVSINYALRRRIF